MKRLQLLPAARHDDELDLGGDAPQFSDESRATTTSASPQTEAVELALVGAVLADNDLYDVINGVIGPDDFSSTLAGAVWKLIAQVIEGEIEGLTVAEPLSLALQPTIRQLAIGDQLNVWAGNASTDPQVVTARATAVRDAAAERRLEAAVQKAQAIAAESGTVEERSTAIEAALNSASESRALPVTSIGDAAVVGLSRLAERASKGETGIGVTTGFCELDTLLGGLHPGNLVVLAARPGIGKTALALAMGLAAARAGHHTTYASLEMLAPDLGMRGVSMSTGIDAQNLRIGALSESDWESAVSAAEHLKTLPLDIVDQDEVNPSSLSSLCRTKKRQGKLDLLIIDYLQLMDTPAGKNANREQIISAISRALKKLASRLGIPVVVLSQLNRGVENRLDKRPQLQDLRESGAIEQDADVVMFIHRDGERAEIIVAKQRSGPTGIVNVDYEAKCTLYRSFSASNSYDPLPFAA